MNMIPKIAYITLAGEGVGRGERHETVVEEAQNIRSTLQARDEDLFTHISADDQYTFF